MLVVLDLSMIAHQPFRNSVDLNWVSTFLSFENRSNGIRGERQQAQQYQQILQIVKAYSQYIVYLRVSYLNLIIVAV